jgi:hypothetical protein
MDHISVGVSYGGLLISGACAITSILICMDHISVGVSYGGLLISGACLITSILDHEDEITRVCIICGSSSWYIPALLVMSLLILNVILL